MYEIYRNGKLNSELLKKEPWLKYLVITKEKNVNVERVNKISDINGSEALEYTLKTLKLFRKADMKKISPTSALCIEDTLKWSEVAKSGSMYQRNKWMASGYPLDIHNLASAEIYKENVGIGDIKTRENNRKKIVYTLIRTHGIIGQYLRGEVPIGRNAELYQLVKSKLVTKEELKGILSVLNYCIIGAVSEELYNEKKNEIEEIVDRIVKGDFKEGTTKARLQRLLPEFKEVSQGNVRKLSPLVKNRELWYAEAALSSFTTEEVMTIFNKIKEEILEDTSGIEHISFYNMAKFLYYDYEDKKKINVYKKRVLEQFLKDTTNNKHVDFEINEKNNVLMVGFKLTPACEKLIEFCVEAERSGMLTYENSITMLFDLFNFRRDEFDRLNNEEKYLETMNAADNSTKKDLINYITGDVIVDVGSGGGVMLDLLEHKYPEKEIIGTDISENVVEHLKRKIKEEDHSYDIKVHNFVNDTLKNTKADTIIFSSILHEIYSYTELDGEKFNINSVKNALKNAKESLSSGGRIIVRDGVKTDSNQFVELEFKTKEGLDFFMKFADDFKGLKDVNNRATVDLSKWTAKMNINVAREFLYTYTWGQESYAHEVQEQFGYFTLKEFVKFAETELDMKVLVAKEFLEPGYSEHLLPLVNIRDTKENDMQLPNSNLIIVLEKK